MKALPQFICRLLVCTEAYLTLSHSWQPECQLGTTSKQSLLHMYTWLYATCYQTSAACWAHVSQQPWPALAVQAPHPPDLLFHCRPTPPQTPGYPSPPSQTLCNTCVTLVQYSYHLQNTIITFSQSLCNTHVTTCDWCSQLGERNLVRQGAGVLIQPLS